MIKTIDEIFEQDEEKRKINLNDGKWQNCNYYALVSPSEGLCRMTIVTLDKKFTINEKEALKYMFLHGLFTYYREAWEVDEPWDSNLFENWVKGDWAVLGEFQLMTNENAYGEYINIFNQIRLYKGSEFYINDKPVESIDIVCALEEMVYSTAFCNDWNSMLYFIECKNKWVLINWGTSA